MIRINLLKPRLRVRIFRMPYRDLREAQTDWGVGFLGSGLLEGYIRWRLGNAGFDGDRPFSWHDNDYKGVRVFWQVVKGAE